MIYKLCICVLFFSSIRALKGGKGEDVDISAPVGICVTTDDGRVLGNIAQVYGGAGE